MSRLLAVDYGTQRIGVALSDPTGSVASPLLTFVHRSLREDAERVAALGREHQVEAIVVGLPRRLDGTEGEAARRVRNFVRALQRATPLPVVLWDERLSTVAAERSLLEGDVSRKMRREVRDRVAAALILQAYLASRGGAAGRGGCGGPG